MAPPNNNINQENPANPNKSPFSNPIGTKFFFGGANTDITKEIFGSDYLKLQVEKEGGQYIDSQNIRVDDEQYGVGKAAKTIRGEEILYTNSAPNYECISSCTVAEHIVEFWAPVTASDGGIVTIDGNIMVRSQYLLFNADSPLAVDVNNDTIGGEVYLTENNRMPPIYFSISDIITNWNNGTPTPKYFSQFQLSQFTISLVFPIDNIVFPTNPLTPVGVGAGLPTGQYCYCFNYVDSAGNQTNCSPQTPPIFVPANIDNSTAQTPWQNLKTIGSDPNPQNVTAYGISMNFRINNYLNYSYIQIIRIPYNAGEPIGFAPQALIVKTIPLSNNQFQIYNYVDSVQNASQNLANATIAGSNVLSVIRRAKAIRYFYNRVILGNIGYEDRNITSGITFLTSSNNNAVVPILDNIGQVGYKDPWNHAYRRGLMHGEVYGIYAVAWDSNYSRSLAIPIPVKSSINPDLIGLPMPNKRDPMSAFMSGDPITYTLAKSWQASTRGQVENTFEVVDYKLGSTRPPEGGEDQSHGANILNTGVSGTLKDSTKPNQVGYVPLNPKKPNDFNESNVMYTPNDAVFDGSVGNWGNGDLGNWGISPNRNPGNKITSYNPNIYNPQYNALGLAVIGIDTYPEWVAGFSIVRTERAGRVVSQGMGFYYLQDAVDHTGTPLWKNNGQKGTGQKRRYQIACHFPDFENGVVSSAVINDIQNNPQNYQIQLVEPLGFSSEVYGGTSNSASNPVITGLNDGELHGDSQIDMVVHAKVQSEIVGDTGVNSGVTGNAQCNPRNSGAVDPIGISDTAQTSSYYTAFGIWRNQANGSPSFNGNTLSTNGNTLFNIAAGGVTLDTSNEEGLNYFVFSLEDSSNVQANLYISGGNADYNNFTDNETRNWHEPVYIVNIVKNGATVSNLDFESLVPTGTFVKTQAVIGLGNGQPNQNCQLCGERTVDCGKLPTDTLDRYVWVQMDVTSPQTYRWINISYLNAGQISTINSDIANGTTVYNGYRLYGTYTCDSTTGFNVVFSSSSYIPPVGGQIQVKYDNRFPIYAFGGDSFIGQTAFPVVHRNNKTDNGNGDTNGWGSFLKLNRAMPYRWFNIKKNYYLPRDTSTPLLCDVQDGEDLLGNAHPVLHGVSQLSIGAVRQMIVLYNCQSYSHLPLAYNDCYPLTNYIIRPQHWDGSHTSRHIQSQYFIDYPSEDQRWRMGGFRVAKQFPFSLDYSKENVDDRYDYVGQLFYSNNTEFYNRMAWSNVRPIQTVLSPNLKTFGPLNVFDLSDNRGQIQRLHSFKHRLYGENLYALCEDDICIVIAQKATISSGSGNTLGTMGFLAGSNFIQEQIWLNESKKGGVKGKFYLTFADNGQEAFFANQNGVFLMTEKLNGSDLIDITPGYWYQLWNSFFSRVQKNGTQLSQRLYGVYNVGKKEYWLSFKTSIPTINMNAASAFTVNFNQYPYDTSTNVPHIQINQTVSGGYLNPSVLNQLTTILLKFSDSTGSGVVFKNGIGGTLFTATDGQWYQVTYNPNVYPAWTWTIVDGELNEYKDEFTFVFSNQEFSKKWLGVFDYKFQRYVSLNNQMFGSRAESGNITTYKLDKGYIMNGSNVVGRIWGTFNPQVEQSFVFNQFRINSNNKPDYIKFYKPDDLSIAISSTPSSLLKNYHGYYGMIPRDGVNLINGVAPKNSNTHLIFQIVGINTVKDFFINSISFLYNKIR